MSFLRRYAYGLRHTGRNAAPGRDRRVARRERAVTLVRASGNPRTRDAPAGCHLGPGMTIVPRSTRARDVSAIKTHTHGAKLK